MENKITENKYKWTVIGGGFPFVYVTWVQVHPSTFLGSAHKMYNRQADQRRRARASGQVGAQGPAPAKARPFPRQT